MVYRWRILEAARNPGTRPHGPYAQTHVQLTDGRKTVITMHRLLMPGVAQIDHLDGDGLNNQRITNLRPATDPQNHANQRASLTYGGRATSSQYKGVTWAKNKDRWVAQIQANGRRKFLGYFTDEITAALVYDAAARTAFGEYARTNFL